MSEEIDLQYLVNRGYLVIETQVGKEWSVRKIPTALDGNPLLPTGKGSETFGSYGPAFENAVAWCLGEKSFDFLVEVQYNDGLGPKFLTLETVKASSPAEAQVKAESLADAHFFGKKKVRWETRIRPA